MISPLFPPILKAGYTESYKAKEPYGSFLFSKLLFNFVQKFPYFQVLRTSIFAFTTLYAVACLTTFSVDAVIIARIKGVVRPFVIKASE